MGVGVALRRVLLETISSTVSTPEELEEEFDILRSSDFLGSSERSGKG